MATDVAGLDLGMLSVVCAHGSVCETESDLFLYQIPDRAAAGEHDLCLQPVLSRIFSIKQLPFTRASSHALSLKVL